MRFVDSKQTIQQRVLSIKLLEKSLYGDALAAVVVETVFSVEQKSLKVRFNTVDGCATNCVANGIMKALFRECCDIICISHSSNLSMKLFEKTTKTAHKFISLWSQCLTQGHKVRAATQLSLGETGIRTHEIRWMAEYRAAVQIYNHFDKVVEIIRDNDLGCASLMGQLEEILEVDKDTLLLELALINDSDEPIANFCNRFEGDGYLAPYVYDKWNGLSEHMSHVLDDFTQPQYQSAVRTVATKIAHDDLNMLDQMIKDTVVKAIPVAQKLQSDTVVRLRDTLNIFRGCRLLGYQFVKATFTVTPTTLTRKIGKRPNFFKNDFYDSILRPWIGNDTIITYCEL